MNWREKSAFCMDKNSWEQLMTAVFEDWSRSKTRCSVKLAWSLCPDSIAQSLLDQEFIDDAQDFGNRVRNALFQPDIAPHKWLFIYKGGKTEKYIVLGCMHCQRANTLYYGPEFMRCFDQLVWY